LAPTFLSFAAVNISRPASLKLATEPLVLIVEDYRICAAIEMCGVLEKLIRKINKINEEKFASYKDSSFYVYFYKCFFTPGLTNQPKKVVCLDTIKKVTYRYCHDVHLI